MKRVIKDTADGSKTIFVEALDEHYHSIHGALAESRHVFIQSGLNAIERENVSILEIGFGTGLNTFITFLEAPKFNLEIDYVGVEAYPVSFEEIGKLNYVSELNSSEFEPVFSEIHKQKWEFKNISYKA